MASVAKKATKKTSAAKAKPVKEAKAKEAGAAKKKGPPGGKSTAARKRRLAALLERLDRLFGEVVVPEFDEVIERAVFLILRERSSSAQATRSLAALRADFADWNEVRCSSRSELARMMLGGSKSQGLRRLHPRAERMKDMIDQVYNDRNDTCMEFLLDLKIRDQIEFLEDLDDLGIHNAYALVQWLSGSEKLVAVHPSMAMAAKLTGIVDTAAVTKVRKLLLELCPPGRLIAMQAHLTQLGELDDDEWTPSMKEYRVEV